jgi:hypothetical protein
VVFNSHTSFQLYHCKFPREYLLELRESGVTNTNVTLNRTKLYDFADILQRGEWFDLFIALLQYLKSGEAKIGYLNRLHPKNPLNMVRVVSYGLIYRTLNRNYSKRNFWHMEPKINQIGKLTRENL